jgi:hypothetical protein
MFTCNESSRLLTGTLAGLTIAVALASLTHSVASLPSFA